MLLPVTALYASASVLLIVYVSYRVTDFRKGVKLSTGYRADISDDAPVTILLLMLAELNGCSVLLLHGIGVIFTGCQFVRSKVLLKVIGRYKTDNSVCRVVNRCILLLLALVNLSLALGLRL